jgi:hypothetical protein
LVAESEEGERWRTEVDEGTEERTERDRYYDVSIAVVGIVDHQKWD